MLTSISPFGERARRQRWGVTVTAYVVASTAAGAAVGALLGVAGGAVEVATPVRLGALAVVAGMGVVVDAGVALAGLRVPGPTRQVDETWLGRYRGWVYGAGYGAQLGAAFTTIVAGSVTYVAFAAALLAGSPAGGALIGGVFGVVRALPVLATARAEHPGALRDLMQRVDAARARAGATAASAQVAAALASTIAVVRAG